MKKYLDIDQALVYARSIIGLNYFLELAAKEYIQKYKKTKELKINLPGVNIQEDEPSKIPTYKDVKKETESLNEETIEKKLKERLESIIPQRKKDIKQEVMQEIRHKIEEKFESINKDYEENIKKDYE